MMLKAFNLTLGALVAFTVWCYAIAFTVMSLHVLVIGGFTVYHLLHS